MTTNTKTVMFLSVVLAAAMCAGTASAQEVPKPEARIQTGSTWDDPEFGALKEIIGMRRVFVSADSDPDTRRLILVELARDPFLTVVDQKREAEFLITTRWSNRRTGVGPDPGGHRVSRNTLVAAEYIVFLRGQIDEEGLQHQRIVWSTTKEQAWIAGITFYHHPAANGTREFLKALAKARNEAK